jgi:hypothetical protein
MNVMGHKPGGNPPQNIAEAPPASAKAPPKLVERPPKLVERPPKLVELSKQLPKGYKWAQSTSVPSASRTRNDADSVSCT